MMYGTLQVVSANVATMEYGVDGVPFSHKCRFLMDAFKQASFDVVAVQESRARHSETRTDGHYIRLISAGHQGNAGVELWFLKTGFWAAGGVVLAPDDFVVWHSNPRVLIVDLHWGRSIITFCVAYAPQSGQSEDTINTWWNELSANFDRIPREQPLFLLGDLNCHVGSVGTDAIGPLAPDIENGAGTRLRQLCTQHQLIIPATYSQWHDGSSHTFVHPKGSRHRLDYILVRQTQQHAICRSWVAQDIELANGQCDHLPVALSMQVQLQPSAHHGFQRRAVYNRTKARDSLQQATFPTLTLTPVPWETDVNDHWHIARDELQAQACKAFPFEKRVQRQQYFDKATWDAMCHRKSLRQEHRALQRDIDAHVLRMVFKAWRTGGPPHDEVQADQFHLHTQCLQDALFVMQRNQCDQRFRAHKKQAWKQWALDMGEKLQQDLQHGDVFRVLKPKRALAKSTKRALPGLRATNGKWCQGRTDIAVAWEKQFGDLENAQSVKLQQLLDKSRPIHHPLTVAELLTIPSIYDLEQAIRGADAAKAPGVDGLGAELFRQDPVCMAQQIYPMLLKAAFRQQWVVEMSGGWLLPLWKRKGNPQQMQHYRGILLEPVLGRIISRAWRKKICPTISTWAAPMQYGGRSGLSIEALHLQARMWQAHAKTQRHNLAIIFVDIKAAFYTIAKPLLCNSNLTRVELEQFVATLGFPDTVTGPFLKHLQNAHLAFKCTGSTLATGSIAATLSHSWFVIPNGTTVMAPQTGSRPGDPLADLLFSMVMSHVLHEINFRLAAVVHAVEGNSEATAVDNVTWVDDVALAVTATADGFIDRVLLVLQTVVDVMAEHGLTLSFGQGKTAVMLSFNGRHAAQAKRQCEDQYHGELAFLTEHFGLTRVPIVQHYRHLGGFLVRHGVVLPEIKIRVSQAITNLHPVRSLLRDDRVDVGKRRRLLHGLGMSVATLHAGTWFHLDKGEQQAWQASIQRIYSLLTSRGPDGSFPHVNKFEAALKAGYVEADEVLHIQRLRLFIQILKIGDEHMIQAVINNHAIMADQAWLSDVQRAWCWVIQSRGDDDIRDVDFTSFFAFHGWSTYQSKWRLVKKWLKQAIRGHCVHMKTYAALKTADDEQRQLLLQHGWTHQDALLQSDHEEEQIGEHPCPTCGFKAATAAGLAVHQHRLRGARIAMRRYAIDGICRVCAKNFCTRPRLLQHLHAGTTDCWWKHCRAFQPLTVEEAQALDNQDCASKQAHHQRGLRDEAQDRACHSCNLDGLPMLPSTGSTFEGPPSAAELSHWASIGLLPPGRGGRQRTQRPRAQAPKFNIQERSTQIEEQLVCDAKNWFAPSSIPHSLVMDTKYVLIFFSGHRRWGDIASWVSWLGTDNSVVPISVDIGLHAVYGDIYNGQLWERLIRARKVVAAHGGPPCETYSLARWLPAPSGRPRPLRNRKFPWGLPARSLKEVQQCMVGTVLMFRTIYLLILVYCYGGAITMEHPAGHKCTQEQWCIWLAGMIQRILRAPDVETIQFLQGPLGQPFSKPTKLLIGRLPLLQRHLYAAYDVGWRSTVTLGGLDSDGWKTAAAKSYPSKLCEVLARSYLWYAERVPTSGHEDHPPQLAMAKEVLCNWDPYTGSTMSFFRDYHTRTDG